MNGSGLGLQSEMLEQRKLLTNIIANNERWLMNDDDRIGKWASYKVKFTPTPPSPRTEAERWAQYCEDKRRIANMSRKPNYGLFAVGFLFAMLAGGTMIPGLDIAAWHFLHPATFWQRFGLIVVELVTLWPRFTFGAVIWGVITTIAAKIAE